MTNAEPSPREQLKQAKLAAAQDRVALKELLAPVRGRTALAQLLQRFHDAGSAVEADLLQDGKTGSFLDQQMNHGAAHAYAAALRVDRCKPSARPRPRPHW